MDEPRHRLGAGGEQMQAVVLEPLGVTARVDVPVDHLELRMLLCRGDDVRVHGDVRVMCSSKRQPPDALHARGLEDGQRRLDVRCVLILEVVVADRDHDVRSELRSHAALPAERGSGAGRR